MCFVRNKKGALVIIRKIVYDTVCVLLKSNFLNELRNCRSITIFINSLYDVNFVGNDNLKFRL